MAWFSKTDKTSKKLKDELWVKCPLCHAHVFNTDWAANIKVCPKCNYHDKLTAKERI